jgi:imidazolonepropionase-like amidohydrolase
MDTMPGREGFMPSLKSVFLLFLSHVPFIVPPAGAQDSSIAFAHVTVIDATGAPPQPDMTVVVADKKIAQLGKSASTHPPKGATVVDATGKFLIPGLWDMHVHEIFGEWIPADEKITLGLFVLNGITGVRDMGGDLEQLKQWRSRIASGELLGPRMIISGPMLDGPTPAFPSSAPLKDATDGTRTVDQLKANGADFIKVQSLVPRDGYFAAAAEAKKIGIDFVGHVPDKIRAVEAVEAGQKSIEHLTGIFEGCSNIEDQLMAAPRGPGRKLFVSTMDPARCKALIELLAKKKVWQCPTLYWEKGEWLIEITSEGEDPLAAYAPAVWRERAWPMFTRDISNGWSSDPFADREAFFQAELKMINDMNRAGVPMLAGTDTAAGVRVYPGFSLHEELTLLVQAGLTPMQALQSATRNAGVFFGLADTGTIAKGNRADLLLLDANPLDNIDNARKIQSLVLNGRYLSRADLDRLDAQIKQAAAASKITGFPDVIPPHGS